MSLVISPSFYQDMDLLAAAASTIDNTEIGTFMHSPFISNNLINTFATPLSGNFNSSAADTVSPMTLNTVTTVIDILSPISTNSTGTPIVNPTNLTDVYNVFMSPSIYNPNSVTVTGTPVIEAQNRLNDLFLSPQGVENPQTPIQGVENPQTPIQGVVDAQTPIQGVENPQTPIQGVENPQTPIEELVDHPIEELVDHPIEELVDHPIENDNKRNRSAYEDILNEEDYPKDKNPRLD
jgi:hypothetical protein